MTTFATVDREARAAKWRAYRRTERQRRNATRKASAAPRNVAAVLSLDEVEFITFRGRAYGVPPVPLAVAVPLTDHYVRALEAMGRLEDTDARTRADALAAFHAHLSPLPALFWRAVRVPYGGSRWKRFWRILRRPVRNPFRAASPGDLLALAALFSRHRMTSGARLVTRDQPEARTSWTR